MRILVTNDDGIAANGLAELACVAVETGADVIVAAPSGERSGSAASLSAFESASGVVTEQVRLARCASTAAYGIHASPALIAMMAMERELGPAPDLVLSGINHGPNTGQSVLHSGTVGAAFTAAAHGVAAVAFSLDAATPRDWATAVIVARRVTAWAEKHAPRGIVINVNIPDVPLRELRGICGARLASFGAAQARVTSEEHTETVTLSQQDDPPTPDSDVALLAEGWATVTAVTAPCQVDANLDDLVDVS